MSAPERPEAIDPDVDLHVAAQRAETAGPEKWAVLAAISAGGAAGASARYALALAWPTPGGGFPWATLLINVVGCALIGVLMPLISEGGRSAHPLARPFLGAGVLGGFTTFSTYAVEVGKLLARQRPGLAMGYAAATLLGALGAVWLAASATRWALAARAGERAGAR
ncbi:fluoride efflux transporter FluC [Streptomyces sp. NPDC059070]|uniref:fluoride efflux transporter FluC n=1 Tax=Streptomyces sp. NPDC059070 TaxID=3346713 RepID=UPI0036823774